MIMNIEKQPSKLIKPWIPTPPTLRHYKMGFIDELAPSANVSIILFFSVNHDHGPKFVTRLEQSLEKTLTRFYPLAGRYVDELMHTIDCNDEGVWFTHAKVINNIKLQDILATEENVKFVDHFRPSDQIRDNIDPLLAIQATVFECGGVTLGVRADHKIVDASTLCTFINEWAATNRDENDHHEFTGPGFNSSSLFPGRSFQPAPLQPTSDDDMASKYIRKVFKFSETAISNMKAKMIMDGNNISTHNRHYNLSKVQLVSAVIWKALIDVDHANNNPRESILIQPVNLREKTTSLIPKHSCGNLWGLCATKAGIVETTEELACRLRDDVKKTINNLSKVDHNTEEGQLTVLNSISLPDIRESTNVIRLSSWCKFPFYDADFGFGKPTWVAPGGVPFINTSCLMDDVRGNGVDAHILLEVKDVPYFEEALQLHAFST